MEVQYKREARGNFLVIEPTWPLQRGYELKMLSENRVEGLLMFRIKYVDEKQLYYYDITSLQPLSRILEGRWISKEEVCRLLLELEAVLKRVGEYLLDGDELLLEPDYIYTDPQWSRIQFCLVPGRAGNFQEGVNRLLQYILKKTDHRDPEGVVLSYGLYQESLKENYGLENLLLLIHRIPGTKEEEECLRKEAAEGQEEEPEEISEEQHLDGYKKNPPTRNAPWRNVAVTLLAWLTAAAGFVLITWFLGGWSALKRWGIFGTAAITAFFGAAIAVSIILKKREKTVDSAGQEEMEIKDCRPVKEELFPDEEAEEDMKDSGKPQLSHFHTVPLSLEEEDGGVFRYLEPRETGMEKIHLPYFPFIIGKQEELVDYCLEEDTVSRLHLRLDQEGEEYMVTDLNSTNGTAVNGRQLEANETVPIRPGDELLISKIFYRFR